MRKTVLLYCHSEAVSAASVLARALRLAGHNARAIDATLLDAAQRQAADFVVASDAMHDKVAAIYAGQDVAAVAEFADPAAFLALIDPKPAKKAAKSKD